MNDSTGTSQVWQRKYSPTAARALAKLAKKNKRQAERIDGALIAACTSGDPRSRGTGLTGARAGQWRYRVGDWRVIVEIENELLIVRAIELGHRSAVYSG